MEEFIYLPKWVIMLVYFSEHNRSVGADIPHLYKITYSHVSKIVSGFEELGYIKTERTGRRKELMVTPLGMQVAEHCKGLLKLGIEVQKVEIKKESITDYKEGDKVE